jgi:hypothetical protein
VLGARKLFVNNEIFFALVFPRLLTAFPKVFYINKFTLIHPPNPNFH